MAERTGFILQRLVETIMVMVISSVSVYCLVASGILPSTKEAYVVIFGASAILFLLLSYILLYRHFWNLDFNVSNYLITNLVILFLFAALSIITLKNVPVGFYTIFFGYTKPFSQLFNISLLKSAVIFWLLYLVLIIVVLIKILFFDKHYKAVIYKIPEE